MPHAAPRRLAILAMAFTLGAVTNALALSDAERAEEAAIIAKEDAAAETMKLGIKTSWEGTLTLTSERDEETGAIGTFTFDGQTHLLRVETSVLAKELQAYNGKSVTLTGRIRVNGKYFIAQSVLVPTPGPPRRSRGKRGGA
jgi:hypothetical protein